MPDYHPRGISMHLATAPLAESTTPNVIVRRGEAAKKQSQRAEEVLQASKRLREKVVAFPGDHQGFHLNWLGDTPLMQVQTIHDSQFYDRWVDGTCASVEKSNSLAAKALVLHVDLSSKAFDSGLNATNNVQLKIEVFLNGRFSNGTSTSSRDRPSGLSKTSRLFAGTRAGFQVEKPWLINIPGRESSEPNGKLHYEDSAEMRYARICSALSWEANQRSIDDNGNIPPSAEFLRKLANMQFPEQVHSMQDPGGRFFGTIDVIITAGRGMKLNSGVMYLTAPRRLDSNNPTGRHQKGDELSKCRDTVPENEYAGISVQDAAVSDVDAVRSDDSKVERPLPQQASAPHAQAQGPTANLPIEHAPHLNTDVDRSKTGSTTKVCSTTTALSALEGTSNPSVALQSQRYQYQLPAIAYRDAVQKMDNKHPHNFSNIVLPPYLAPFPACAVPSSSNTLWQSASPNFQSPVSSVHTSSNCYFRPPYTQPSGPFRPPLNALHNGSTYRRPLPRTVADSQIDPRLLSSSASQCPQPYFGPFQGMNSHEQMLSKNKITPIDCPPSQDNMQGQQMPTIPPTTVGPRSMSHLINHAPFSIPHTYPQAPANSRAPTVPVPLMLPPRGLYTVPTKPKARDSPYTTIAAIRNDSHRSSFLLKRLVVVGKDGTEVVNHTWSVAQRIALKMAHQEGGPDGRLALTARGEIPTPDPRVECWQSVPQTVTDLGRSTLPTSTSAPDVIEIRMEEYDKKVQDSGTPGDEQGIINNGSSGQLDHPILPPSASKMSVEANTPLAPNPSTRAPKTSHPASQRQTYSKNRGMSVQGPEAKLIVLENPEEVLRKARRSRRACSPEERGSGSANTSIQSSTDPSTEELHDRKPPLSSPPGSPMQDVRSVLSDSAILDKRIPQLDGPSDEREDATRVPPGTETTQLGPIPNLPPPWTLEAASRLSTRDIPQSTGKRKRALTSTSTTSYAAHYSPLSNKQDTPISSSAPPDRSLNENCVIGFAEGDEQGVGGALRQIRAERSGWFREEYVVVAARFYVPGWFGGDEQRR